MYVTELNSFIQKFNDLWKNGLTAHLDIDCCNEFAWVGLRLQLGHQPGPGPQHHQVTPILPHRFRKKNNPPRQRRRAKREAERAAKVATDAEDVDTAIEVSKEPSENVTNDSNAAAVELTTNVSEEELKERKASDEIAVNIDESFSESITTTEHILNQVSTILTQT